MTTPTLSEATKRLAGAVPAKPEWAGSVSVDSRDLETVLTALDPGLMAFVPLDELVADDDTETA